MSAFSGPHIPKGGVIFGDDDDEDGRNRRHRDRRRPTRRAPRVAKHLRRDVDR